MVEITNLLTQNKPLVPSIYRTAELELSSLRGQRRRIEQDRHNHSVSIKDILADMESRLFRLIPPSETTLLRILKTTIEMDPGGPFLKGLLHHGFDERQLSMQKEFGWKLFVTALPFVINPSDLKDQFGCLNKFWANYAELSVVRDEPYYYFTFKWT